MGSLCFYLTNFFDLQINMIMMLRVKLVMHETLALGNDLWAKTASYQSHNSLILRTEEAFTIEHKPF